MTESPPLPDPPPKREPIFNPKAFEAAPVIALVVAMIAIHAWVSQASIRDANALYRDYAFVSAQFWKGEELYTLVSYAMLHGSWAHIGFNCVAFFVLGSACWKLMGSARFFAFFVVTAAAGAALFAAVRPDEVGVLVGASGVIFGLLAAIKRVEYRVRALRGQDVRKATAFFVLAMVAINVIIGMIPLEDSGGLVGEAVAWEAHIGGLLVGWVVTPWLVKFWPN